MLAMVLISRRSPLTNTPSLSKLTRVMLLRATPHNTWMEHLRRLRPTWHSQAREREHHVLLQHGKKHTETTLVIHSCESA